MAIMAMIVDHIGVYFFPEGGYVLRLIGRAAFPSFLFLVGYSSNWRNSSQIWLMAILLQVAEIVTNGPVLSLNVLFTIMATRLLFSVMEKKGYLERPATIFIGSVAWLLPSVIIFEYGTSGVMFALCGWYIRHKGPRRDTLKVFASAFIIHAAAQAFMFENALWQAGLLSLEMLALAAMLYHFRLRDISLPKGAVRSASLFLSRNALYFYVVHLLVLRAVAIYIDPARFAEFRWL